MRARVGVVGAGWWATTVHLPALRDNPDAELVGVCDLDLDRAARAAADAKAAHAVATVSELLNLGLDAVLVATHHNDHYTPAATALGAGVDVCVEKPMTITPAEAWSLVDLARANGANLHVGYTFPYLAAAARLRDSLSSGELGDLLTVTSVFATSIVHLYRHPHSPYADPVSGGQLHTQATHPIALVLWLTSARAVTVYATSTTIPGVATDVADTLLVHLDNGAVASFTSTGSLADQNERIEEYRFFGASGHAVLDTHRDEPNPLTAPAAALIATALGRASVVVSGELGARTVDVLDTALRSIRSGRPEIVPRR